MKVLITSLNSKYIHLNLAIRYLKKYINNISNIEVEIADYTINQNKDDIIKGIYKSKPDIVAFSIYIWNYTMTLKVIRKLKKINPGLIIIVGGPEVSYNPEGFLKKALDVDFLIIGEGEIPFQNLIKCIVEDEQEISVSGVAYRINDEIIVNNVDGLMDIRNLVFPYDSPIEKNKLIYYETSRGCPYSCSYCISSTIKGVRFKDLDLVKKDLKFFVDERVKIVKFIDRTFNVDKKRSLEILKFIIDNDAGYTTFHMELAPHLIDNDWMNLLKNIRKNLIQFEIGIQSVNENVITEVNRKIFFDNYEHMVKKLIDSRVVHIHVDLIAGLPLENYDSLLKSFNSVYKLKADHFQLGFLKLLKGSPLHLNHLKYGYIFDEEPPYEVISNNYISYDELIRIKEIEELLELYYNSHHFEKSIEFIVDFWESPSDFFESFARYWCKNEYFDQKHQLIALFEFLFNLKISNSF